MFFFYLYRLTLITKNLFDKSSVSNIISLTLQKNLKYLQKRSNLCFVFLREKEMERFDTLNRCN